MKLSIHRSLFHTFFIFLCISVLSIISCSSGSKPKNGTQTQVVQQKSGPGTEQNEKLAKLGITPPRPYASKAIRIKYSADENLNIYEEKPHSLTFVVYQLSDINPFNNLIKDAAGLTTLLKAEKFDQSVMAVDRFFIAPGESNLLDIDRYENVKWLGIVAGYYNLTPGQVTRSYELPVIFETTGKGKKQKTEARMGVLGIHLYFGPRSLQEVLDK